MKRYNVLIKMYFCSPLLFLKNVMLLCVCTLPDPKASLTSDLFKVKSPTGQVQHSNT